MSYILDALKKAEQERQRGSVPDLQTLQDDIIPKPRRKLRAGPVIALLLVIAAATTVWWFSQSSSGSKTGQPPVGQQAEPALRETSAVSQGSPPAGPVQAAPRPIPETNKETTVIKEISVDRPVVTHADIGRNLPETPRPVQRPVPKADLPPERSTQPVARPAALARNEGPTASPKPVATEAPPSPDRLYALRDLPASVRKGLPPLSLSAFMYASDPAGRMVRVNDQMLHEGQDLSPGLRLQEITPDGVIFSYQGFRISVLMKPDQAAR